MERMLVRRICFTGGLLLLTMVFGTIGFMLVEGYSLFDAAYMTLITITTAAFKTKRVVNSPFRK